MIVPRFSEGNSTTMRDTAWLLAIAAAAVWGLTCAVPPPTKMVVIAFWIFLVVKMQAWRRFQNRTTRRSTAVGTLQWFFMTPTLDASRFVESLLPECEQPTRYQWSMSVLKTVLGTILFFFGAGLFVPGRVLIAGWIAMTGIVLMLHFGILEIIVLSWRRQGRDLKPLMRQPIAASSLSDFWGRRWNTGFRDFAHENIFQPMCRRSNTQVATFTSFVFSGLIHDLAISVPAGTGYGWPTAYFLLQWLGVTLERIAGQHGWSVRSGFCGWLFAASFVVAPARILFHDAFVQNVIVPLIPVTIQRQ